MMADYIPDKVTGPRSPPATLPKPPRPVDSSVDFSSFAERKAIIENEIASARTSSGKVHEKRLTGSAFQTRTLVTGAAERGVVSFSGYPAEHISETKAKSQMVILLLGETGVGKSTTIDSFGVHLRCATMEEAERTSNEELFLIPLQFNDTDPITYLTRRIAVGHQQDANEFHDVTGDSVTQDPKIHILKLVNLTLTIIDTPGVGDTAGVEKDKENVQKILSCLSNFKHLDAICLLLKPNQARLEDRFKYCLREILRNLHESARKNIVICFTNGKAVSFRPGDTVGILKQFFSDDDILKQIEINPKTVYYLENEPVRYLAKVKSGARVDYSERKSAADCWEKSTAQLIEMFNHIASLPKHNVIGMVSINDARRVIGNITPLLVDVTKCIVKNVKAIEKQKLAIQAKQVELQNAPATLTHVDLSNVLYRDEYKIEEERLDHSITVCMSDSCSQTVDGTTVHTKVCDPRCRWTPTLRFCIAMNTWTGYCKICGCHYKKHQWKTTQTKIAKTTVGVPQPRHVNTPNPAYQEIKYALVTLEESYRYIEVEKQNYITEKNQMLESCAKLSLFLQQNSMIKNDETNDFMYYLRPQIKSIKKKTPLDAETREAIVELEQMESEYQRKRAEVEAQAVEYTALAVKKLIEDLFKLPLKGQELQVALKVVEDSKAAAVKHAKSEEVHVIKKVATKFLRLFGWLK